MHAICICDIHMRHPHAHCRRLRTSYTRGAHQWKKVEYVLCSSEDLQQHLKALKDDFDALKELVKTALHHQPPRPSSQSETCHRVSCAIDSSYTRCPWNQQVEATNGDMVFKL